MATKHTPQPTPLWDQSEDFGRPGKSCCSARRGSAWQELGKSFVTYVPSPPSKPSGSLKVFLNSKGQALLGERNRVWFAFVSGQNRKRLPPFYETCQLFLKSKCSVVHTVIQAGGTCGSSFKSPHSLFPVLVLLLPSAQPERRSEPPVHVGSLELAHAMDTECGDHPGLCLSHLHGPSGRCRTSILGGSIGTPADNT